MNKSDLIKIIEKFNGKLFNCEKLNTIDNLTTNLQFADDSTLTFYNLIDAKAEDVFLTRLKGANPGLILLNRNLKSSIETPYVVMDEDKIKGFTEELVNTIYPINDKIKIYGITGTNGKSTCVCLCEQIVRQINKTGASLGTIGLTINGKEKDLNITGTTPSYIDLRRVINKIQDEVDYLFMEVSSHAIVQNRLGEVRLAGAAWTSFSQDHLDYHGTMEEYFKAKADITELFENKETKMRFPASQTTLIDKFKDLKKNINVKSAKTLKDLGYESAPPFFKVHYNKDNLELSLSLLEDELGDFVVDIFALEPPKGRFSIEKVGESYAVIDYAHTPDAIENLVKATEMAFPDSKIITLFGCGGDRDKTKRPLMAVAAEKYGSGVIVTTDNPRSEVPQEILNDILLGLSNKPLLVEVDREKAINEGLQQLGPNDVLIIAGKGHEEYQEIKGEKIYFSDFDVVRKYRDSLK